MDNLQSKFAKIIILVIIIFGYYKIAESKTLNVRYHVQHTAVWCWAASIAMVAEYESGYRIEDCEVLSYYSGLSCCSYPYPCMRGGFPNEISYILNNFGVYVTTKYRNLSFEEIKEEIDNNNPIIAWVQNSAISAHVVVISGYRESDSYEDIKVLDPYFGPHWRTYSDFVESWQTGVWSISYVLY